MRRASSEGPPRPAAPAPGAEELAWSAVPALALRTLRADRRRYRPAARALTLRRLWRSVRPALDRPLFIVGAPRSGTTFLGECLASLPEMSYHYEPVLTRTAVTNVWTGQWSPRVARFVYRSTYAWLVRVHLDGDLRFAEKTPRNSHIVPFLAAAFPGAAFLHIVRDGRDVALSLARQPWYRGAGGAVPFWVEPGCRPEFAAAPPVRRCVWTWRAHVEAVLNASSSLAPGRYCQVRYEDLLASPAAEAGRLLDFLEIGRPESRARFEAAVAAGRGEAVGRWRTEMARGDVEVAEREAGPLLRRLGYPVT